jgi:hypothetical protein
MDYPLHYSLSKNTGWVSNNKDVKQNLFHGKIFMLKIKNRIAGRVAEEMWGDRQIKALLPGHLLWREIVFIPSFAPNPFSIILCLIPVFL